MKCCRCGLDRHIGCVVNFLDIKNGSRERTDFAVCDYCKEDLRRWLS